MVLLLERIINTIKGALLFLALSLNIPSTSLPTLYQRTGSGSATTKTVTTPQPSNTHTLPKPVSTPTPSPPLLPANNSPGYQLEPHPSGEEGVFVLKNVLPEPMSTEDELNAAVNAYRQTHSLNILQIDPQLCDIARQRAVEAETEFSHAKFESHVENGDYNHVGFLVIGENLWQGSFSGVHIVEFGWDQSPGHRANLQGNWSRGCGGIHQQTAAFIFAR